MKKRNWHNRKLITISPKLKYVGVFIVSFLLALNAYYIHKQTREQNRNNHLIVKEQLDTRFKDAVILLASGNTIAELSGIHALHQIAVETSQTEDQKDYVRVIKDILISFIKENSVIEYKKDGNGKVLFYEPYFQNIDTAYNTKSKIVLQTIIDKLFIDDGCEIYAEYTTYLSEIVLKEIKFSWAKLQTVCFRSAQLQNTEFTSAQLQNASFAGTQLQNANFSSAQLQNARFEVVQLENVNFKYAILQNAGFYTTILENANFKGAYNIDEVHFFKVSWNKKTNFKSTAFENKTIEELTKIMGKPPIPLNE